MRNVLIFFSLVLVLVGVSLAVNTAPAVSKDWPRRFSGLNDWNGLRVVKGVRCPECYSLVIPKTFGLAGQDELVILTDLPKKKVDDSLDYDLDGPIFVDVDVLDHLLHLAIDHDSLAAGRIILSPEKHEMLIGVETSEDIEGTHIIPLIHGFRDLNALIDGEAEYRRLAQNICNWSAITADFNAANSLVADLKKRQYAPFATVLSTACKAEKESMKAHGKNFIGE
jgi:hypothetical protein